MRTLLIVIALFAGQTRAGETDNLLANGGFEDKLQGWTVQARVATYTATKKGKVKGKWCLHARKPRAFSHGEALFADFEIPRSRRNGHVVVSLRAKGKKLGNAWLRCYLYDAAGQTLNRDVDLPQLRGTFKWTRHEKRFAVPKSAVRGRVLLNLYMGEELWLDDIRVVHKPGAGEQTSSGIRNGGFEEKLKGWITLPSTAGRARASVDRTVKNAGKGALRLRRRHQRLFPQAGVSQSTPTGGVTKLVLRYQVRASDGARAVVTLLAFGGRGDLVASAHRETSPSVGFVQGELPLTLPAWAETVTVSLEIAGSGSVWFDDVTLEEK